MKYSQLYAELDGLFPVLYRAKWDNDGAMIKLNDNELSRILISLDVNKPTIEYAVNGGFDLIVSHHPLIFSPLRAITAGDTASDRVLELIKNKINVMSFHTRLDCVGVNEELAAKLELSDILPFDFDGVPMGRIGTLPCPMAPGILSLYIKEKLGAENVTYPRSEKQISRLALLGGGGCSAAIPAKYAGADALLTGDYSYNSMLDMGEGDFPVFAAGHFHTEQPVCDFLRRTIEEIIPGIYTEVFSSYTLKSE